MSKRRKNGKLVKRTREEMQKRKADRERRGRFEKRARNLRGKRVPGED